jgi:hypothetical protein
MILLPPCRVSNLACQDDSYLTIACHRGSTSLCYFTRIYDNSKSVYGQSQYGNMVCFVPCYFIRNQRGIMAHRCNDRVAGSPTVETS